MYSFNVLTEPWIRAIDHHNNENEYSLLDLLANAHHLEGIYDPSPVIQFGVYRLLITFTQVALNISELEDIEDVLSRGSFDMNRIHDYVERVGKEKFDLFHPDTPFLQHLPPEEGYRKDKKASPAKMLFFVPKGNNVVHFYHGDPNDIAISPEVAVRALCSLAPFATIDGQGYSSSINGTPPWYVLAIGDTLFETLTINCIAIPFRGLTIPGTPSWEQSRILVPGETRQCTSLAEGYTWSPRQIRLIPSEGGTCSYSGRKSSILIREIIWDWGYKFTGENKWLDPFVAYKKYKNGFKSLNPNKNHRQVWRDYAPLFFVSDNATGSEDDWIRPAIVTQIEELKKDRILSHDKAERFELYGMRTLKAKVLEWYYEQLPVSHSILQMPEKRKQVLYALGVAEKVEEALGNALNILLSDKEKKRVKKTAKKSMLEQINLQFWDQVENMFLGHFLENVATQAVDDQESRINLTTNWENELQKQAWKCYDIAERSIGSDIDIIGKKLEARRFLAIRLSKLLKLETNK